MMLGKITPFVHSTFKIVSDSKTDDIISWNPFGDSFIIKDQYRFQCEVLPRYFKHNNLSSFIRQLNTYQFHKVPIDAVNFPTSSEAIIFSHPQFLKDREDLLPNIVRRNSSKRGPSPSPETILQPNFNAPRNFPPNNPPESPCLSMSPVHTIASNDTPYIRPEIMAKQVIHMYNRLEETNNLLVSVHNELIETKDMLYQLQQSSPTTHYIPDESQSSNSPHLPPIDGSRIQKPKFL